ncbi:MAG TPA: hypothetical protein PKE12_05630 [Kiritimatiellia bacterium]|nr:hypothetical protein [Kiritimatiellia bacterium]
MRIGRLHALAVLLAAGAVEGDVLRVLRDFEDGVAPSAPPVTSVAVALSPETVYGAACLRVEVADGFNWRWRGWSGTSDAALDAVRVATLSAPYLPPTADAIRLRVRVAAGRAILAVGGPVSQMGPSDVFCDQQPVDAADGAGWRTIEFSLNHRLARNFRRAGFTAGLPFLSYTRWAQEPLALYLVAPADPAPVGATVIFIDQVEAVARGEGRPFPQFEPADMEQLAVIADFEDEGDRAKVLSVGHGYSILESFIQGFRRLPAGDASAMPAHVLRASPFIREEGLRYPAPRYTFVQGATGGRALQAECIWAEEGQVVAITARGAENANAVALAIKPDFPATASGGYAFTHEGRPANAVDFVAFVAPGGAFPWSAFGPSDELRQALRDSGYVGPGATYDALLTTDPKAAGVCAAGFRAAGDWGFYTARRYVSAGDWSDVIVPLDDFVAIHGQGACAAWRDERRPLRPGDIAAIGVVMPFGSGHGTLALDNLAWVRVPRGVAPLQSFWQVPREESVRMLPLPRFTQYGGWSLMTTGGPAPARLLGSPVR